jgi:hypothetical protein
MVLLDGAESETTSEAITDLSMYLGEALGQKKWWFDLHTGLARHAKKESTRFIAPRLLMTTPP